MENVLSISNRTELRLTSKNSTNFKVKIGKSIFEKSPKDDGGFSFSMKDIEDPKNPRRNGSFSDEPKFITAMMNRVYYLQEKGNKNPIDVKVRIPIAELEDAITIEEPKESKTPKSAKKAPKKSTAKSKK